MSAKFIPSRLLTGCLAIFALKPLYAAPALAVGQVTGHAGQTVALPVQFDPAGASVSSMQFELNLPKELTAGNVTLASGPSSAGKSISARLLGHHWRILIVGMNQSAIPAGLLLTATVKLAPQARGFLSVAPSHIVYADPSGRSLPPGKGAAGKIEVGQK